MRGDGIEECAKEPGQNIRASGWKTAASLSGVLTFQEKKKANASWPSLAAS